MHSLYSQVHDTIIKIEGGLSAPYGKLVYIEVHFKNKTQIQSQKNIKVKDIKSYWARTFMLPAVSQTQTHGSGTTKVQLAPCHLAPYTKQSTLPMNECFF